MLKMTWTEVVVSDWVRRGTARRTELVAYNVVHDVAAAVVVHVVVVAAAAAVVVVIIVVVVVAVVLASVVAFVFASDESVEFVVPSMVGKPHPTRVGFLFQLCLVPSRVSHRVGMVIDEDERGRKASGRGR